VLKEHYPREHCAPGWWIHVPAEAPRTLRFEMVDATGSQAAVELLEEITPDTWHFAVVTIDRDHGVGRLYVNDGSIRKFYFGGVVDDVIARP